MSHQKADQSQIGSRNAAADSIYLLLGSVLSTILSLLTGLLLVRVLLPEHYGMVAYFLKVFGLTRLVGTLGLGAKVIEDISRASALAEKDGLGRSFYTLGLVRVSSGTVLVVVLTVLAQINGQPAFFWAGLASLFASMIDYASAVSQGFRKRRPVALLSVVQPLLFLATGVALAASREVTPEQVYAAFTFSLVPTLGLYGLVLRRTAIPQFSVGYLSLQYLRAVMVPLGSLFVVGILNYLYLSLGTLMLGQSQLFEDAAYFNAALTLFTMPGTLGLVVATAVFYPDLVTSLAHKDQEAATKILETFLRGTSLVLIVPAVVCMIYPDFVISLLYTDKYADSIIPLSIASPLIVFLFLQQLLIFGMYALKRHALTSKGYGIQVLLTSVGLLLVVGWFKDSKVVAVALVYLVSGLVGFTIHWRDLRKLLPCRFSLPRLIAALFTAGFVMGLGRQIGQLLIPEPSPVLELLWLAFASIAGFLAILPLFIMRDEMRWFWSRLVLWVDATRDRFFGLIRTLI